jgi:hypothetical protein
MKDQVSHPYKTTGKIIMLYILYVLERRVEGKTKYSELNSSKHSLNKIQLKLHHVKSVFVI